MTARRAPPFRVPGITALMAIAFAALCVGHLGRLTFFFPDSARTLILAAELGLLMCGAGICVLRRNFAPLLWAGAGVAVILFQVIWFAHNFGTQVVPATLAIFLPALGFLTFVPALEDGHKKILLNALLLISVGYAAIYILLSLNISSLPQTPPGMPQMPGQSIVIGADPVNGRPARVVLLSEVVALGGFLSASRLLKRGSLIFLAPLAICTTAIWLSYSRTGTVLYVAILLGYFAIRSAKAISLGAAALFVAGSAWLLISLFFANSAPFTALNPYDSSGVMRDISFSAVRRLASEYWLLGAGLATNDTDVMYLMGSNMFFWSDLGVIGAFFCGGAVAVVLYGALHLTLAFSRWHCDRLALAASDGDGLALTAALMVAYGVMSPALETSLVTGVLGAVAMEAARLKRPMTASANLGFARRAEH